MLNIEELNNDCEWKYSVNLIETEECKAVILGKKTDKGIKMVRTTLFGAEYPDPSGIIGIPLSIIRVLCEDYYHTENSEMIIIDQEGNSLELEMRLATEEDVEDRVVFFPAG